MKGPHLDPLREAVLRALPHLAGASFHVLAQGWHSTAVEVKAAPDALLVCKFPRSPEAEVALRREAGMLTALDGRVTLPIPRMRLHETSWRTPAIFSSHTKIAGDHLLGADYRRLSVAARERLAGDLARFHAELHAIDTNRMTAAGAVPVEAWQTPAAVRDFALPALPSELRAWAEDAVTAYERLSSDPLGEVYGFFDGHGWNMAFDHERGRLNGIYDFADSGIGALHREFVYSSFVSPDLTDRMVSAYEGLTGTPLDRKRIAVLTGMHRLSELAALAHDPVHRPEMVRNVVAWAAAG